MQTDLGSNPTLRLFLSLQNFVGLRTLSCDFTADAEINVPSVENPKLTDVLPKPEAGQNIATHASPTARNLFLVIISTFPVHSPSLILSSKPLPTPHDTAVTGSCVEYPSANPVLRIITWPYHTAVTGSCVMCCHRILCSVPVNESCVTHYYWALRYSCHRILCRVPVNESCVTHYYWALRYSCHRILC